MSDHSHASSVPGSNRDSREEYSWREETIFMRDKWEE